MRRELLIAFMKAFYAHLGETDKKRLVLMSARFAERLALGTVNKSDDSIVLPECK